MGIIRKTIGYLLLTGILPCILFVHWYFTAERVEYHWYVPIVAGYFVDLAVAIFGFILMLIFSLIEDN